MSMSETATRRSTRSGRPRRGKTQEPVERILDTATRLFASRGFAGTSIDQVAALCGAGKDTIYRRFPSKVALFEAVVEHARLRALAQVPDITAIDGQPLERLQRLLQLYLAINMEPDLIALKRITFSEAVVLQRATSAVAEPDPLMARLIDAVAAAQAAGALVPGNAADLAAHLIHALVAVPITDAMLGGTAFANPDALHAHFITSWSWLLKGVSTA